MMRRRALRAAFSSIVALAAQFTPAWAANYRTVDLSPWVASTNAAFNSTESDTWRLLPLGQRTFEGVPFRVDGRIEVTGLGAARAGDFAPTRVSIPIGQKLTRFILLHGVVGDEAAGVPVAQLTVHYADGTKRNLRLAYGVHVRNWTPERGEPTNALPDTGSAAVWTAPREESDRAAGTEVRLYRTILENPLPDREVERVEFVSFFSRVTPFLAALTLEENGVAAGATRPGSGGRLLRKVHEFDEAAYRGQFAVTALDAATRQPMTNAAVSLTITDDEYSFFFGEARADARGRIVLEYPPQHTVAYGMLIKAPGRLPVAVSDNKLKSEAFEHDVAVRLERGTRVGGLVRDSAGKPIPNAEVVVHKITRDATNRFTRVDYDAVRTGGDGRWESTAAPTNFSGFNLQVTHPEFRPALFSDVPAPGIDRNHELTVASLQSREAVLTLQPASRLRGIVRNPQGKAVPGAEVHYQPSARTPPKRVATTDATGAFAFATDDPETGSLFVIARGFAPRFQPAPRAGDDTRVDVTLSEPRPTVIYVRDQYQQPVGGAVVKTESWRDTSLLKWRGVADAQGRVEWEGAPEDAVMLSVSQTNHSTMRIMIGSTGGEQHFTLQKRSQVIGRVTDADTGQAIPEFRIIRGRAYSRFEPMRWERYNMNRGRNGAFTIALNDYYGSEGRTQIMVEAPGYLPQASPEFGQAGAHKVEFALRKGRGLGGLVKTPAGEPAAGASVVLVDKSESAYMDRPGQFQRNSSVDSVSTDPAGRFEFQPRLDVHSVLVAHATGFAQVPAGVLPTNNVITLVPWGRVTGTARIGDKPGAGQTVQLQNMYFRYGEEGRNGSALSLYLQTETDAAGNFTFDRVPPGERKVSIRHKFRENRPGPIPLSHGFPLQVPPGGSTNVIIGGTGRPVIGRIKLASGNHEDVDWLRDVHTLTLQVPVPPAASAGLDMTGATTPEEQRKRQQEYERRQREFWNTDAGRELDRKGRTYVLLFDTNGTFRIDDVPPGDYQLQISPTDPQRENYSYQQIGNLYQQVKVPAPPPGKPVEPHDLGELSMSVRSTNTRTGGRAPPLRTQTFDGKPVSLEDYRGRFVLLDFWAMWNAASRRQELNTLTNLHARYAANSNLVIISLNIDPQRTPGEAYLKTNSLPWLQCHLGEAGMNSVMPSFGFEGLPANALIDPQGRIHSRNLRGASLLNTVRRALTQSGGTEN